MKRRSCWSRPSPRWAGCRVKVRNGPLSPSASISSSTRRGAEGADQLVLQVRDADEVGARPRPGRGGNRAPPPGRTGRPAGRRTRPGRTGPRSARCWSRRPSGPRRRLRRAGHARTVRPKSVPRPGRSSPLPAPPRTSLGRRGARAAAANATSSMSSSLAAMQRSTDRILTTHVGSLPRPAVMLDLLLYAGGEHAARGPGPRRGGCGDAGAVAAR